jgi:hypothetical protein
MLLPTNSQFYPEMKLYHFCQESHTKTWLCFVSGHTVFYKIRRKSPHQHFYTRRERKKETEDEERGKRRQKEGGREKRRERKGRRGREREGLREISNSYKIRK